MAFMKSEFDKFKRLLKKEKLIELVAEDNYSAREGALNITLQFLKKMDRNDIADRLEKCKKAIKRLRILLIQINSGNRMLRDMLVRNVVGKVGSFKQKHGSHSIKNDKVFQRTVDMKTT